MPVQIKTQIGIELDGDNLKTLVKGEPLVLVHGNTSVHITMDEATRGTLHSDEPAKPAE
jgi:hypothetical protein